MGPNRAWIDKINGSKIFITNGYLADASSVLAAAAMEGALAETAKYVKERKAFGGAIAEFQNTRFILAEIATRSAR